MFCDKESLAAELKAAMETAEKKAKGKLTKDFEARRQAMEAKTIEVAAGGSSGPGLPAIFASFAALHAELRLELAAIEACFEMLVFV